MSCKLSSKIAIKVWFVGWKENGSEKAIGAIYHLPPTRQNLANHRYCKYKNLLAYEYMSRSLWSGTSLVKVSNGSARFYLSHIFLILVLEFDKLRIPFIFSRTREVPNWSRKVLRDLNRPDLCGRSTVSWPVKICIGVDVDTHRLGFFIKIQVLL